MLGDDEVHAAIPIKIGDRAAALLTVYFDARLERSQGTEPALPIAKQHQSDSGIVAGSLGINTEKILRQEYVLAPVSVKVGYAHSESRRELRFDGQSARFKVISPVQE